MQLAGHRHRETHRRYIEAGGDAHARGSAPSPRPEGAGARRASPARGAGSESGHRSPRVAWPASESLSVRASDGVSGDGTGSGLGEETEGDNGGEGSGRDSDGESSTGGSSAEESTVSDSSDAIPDVRQTHVFDGPPGSPAPLRLTGTVEWEGRPRRAAAVLARQTLLAGRKLMSAERAAAISALKGGTPRES